MLEKEQRAQKRLLQKSGQIIAVSEVAVFKYAVACMLKLTHQVACISNLLFCQLWLKFIKFTFLALFCAPTRKFYI